jgi:hypothetical protein
LAYARAHKAGYRDAVGRISSDCAMPMARIMNKDDR